MHLRLRWALSSILLLMVAVPAFAQTPHPSSSSLQDAITSGRMTVDFVGDGGSSGDSIKARPAKGRKAGPGPVEAVIPPGSILRSGDPGAQSMMVVGVRGKEMGGGLMEAASRIIAGGKQPSTYILSAFCIQFEKENPSSSTTFTLEQPDPVLACIARHSQSISIPAVQAAVWMYTDQVTYAAMSHKFPVSMQDWEAGQSAFQECQGQNVVKNGSTPLQVESLHMNAVPVPPATPSVEVSVPVRPQPTLEETEDWLVTKLLGSGYSYSQHPKECETCTWRVSHSIETVSIHECNLKLVQKTREGIGDIKSDVVEEVGATFSLGTIELPSAISDLGAPIADLGQVQGDAERWGINLVDRGRPNAVQREKFTLPSPGNPSPKPDIRSFSAINLEFADPELAISILKAFRHERTLCSQRKEPF